MCVYIYMCILYCVFNVLNHVPALFCHASLSCMQIVSLQAATCFLCQKSYSEKCPHLSWLEKEVGRDCLGWVVILSLFIKRHQPHRLLTKDRKCLPGLAHVVTVRMKEPHYVRLPGTERKAKDFSTTQNQSHNHTGFGSSLQNEVKINLIKLFWKINEINYVRALCNLWSSVVKSVINRRQ